MTYLNSALQAKASLPVEEYHMKTPAAEYDLNYAFPVKDLESDAVRLVPFIPSLHAAEAWENLSTESGKGLFTYMPFNAPESQAEFLTFVEQCRRNSAWVTFAIMDKHPDGQRMAGMISYINTEATNLALEIGAVFVFSQYQRTHINTHANSLLLKYAFEELGLRRVQWRANMLNAPSVAAAERLGFKMEGVILWHRVLPSGKPGLSVAPQSKYGTPQAGPGRHSATLSITWETWEESAKATIDRIMAREVKR